MYPCECDACNEPDWEVWTLTYDEGLAELARVNWSEGDSLNFYAMMDDMCANWGLPSATVLQDMDEVVA